MYNRQNALAYANRWWHSANPIFPAFSDDCTNFVSQCLWAGGAPMTASTARDVGWWYKGREEQWSFSWAVAHSLRWYLAGAKRGLIGRQVEASTLEIGDVIFYDFTGDGRIDHSVIVTSMRAGVPYVHAHTASRANVPYNYAYAARYYFFHIEVVLW